MQNNKQKTGEAGNEATFFLEKSVFELWRMKIILQ